MTTTDEKLIVDTLQYLLKKKFRLIVHFPDGTQFPLKGLRLNYYRYIRLELPHHVIFKPKDFSIYTCLNPEWSCLVMMTEQQFPTAKFIRDLQIAQEVMKEYQPVEEDDYEEHHLHEDYSEADEVIFNFCNQFMLEGGRNLYFFFKHSPFNNLDEEIRQKYLRLGQKRLLAFLQAQSDHVRPESD